MGTVTTIHRPWHDVGLPDGLVAAGRVEKCLHLEHGTVKRDYQAGQLEAVPRKARRGKASIWLTAQEAWRMYGPRKLEARRA